MAGYRVYKLLGVAHKLEELALDLRGLQVVEVANQVGLAVEVLRKQIELETAEWENRSGHV